MYLGIDVGGTFLKTGLVSEDGALCASQKLALEAQDKTQDGIFAALCRLVRLVQRESGDAVQSIGIGVPGAADADTGTIRYLCNVAEIRDFPLGERMRQEFGLPVYLENDANCAALGEYYFGAGKGRSSLLVLTIGTGIGGGIIQNGRILSGFNGAAGEVGHMSIVPDGETCNCGRRGCWERYASASALCRFAREAMRRAPESLLWTLCGGDEEKIDGRILYTAADRGDAAALAVSRDFAAHFARGTVNLINLFAPEVVAIGGGVSAAPDHLLLDPVRRIVERECYAARAGLPMTGIVRAQLGNDAGIIGAAFLGKMSE